MPLASNGEMLAGSGLLRLGFRGAGRRRGAKGREAYLPGRMGARGWDTGVLRPQDLDPKLESISGYATEGQLKARRLKWGRNNGRNNDDKDEKARRRAYDRTRKRRERREARRLWRREQGYSSESDNDDEDDDEDYLDEDARADLEETRRREFVRKNWKASCYGHPAPRGWDTGAASSTNPTANAHPVHHDRLHRYFPAAGADDPPKYRDHDHLWDTRHPKPRARLKFHRYPWNKPDLVPSGVDCKEPKTYRLHGEKYSRVINRWKARAEKVRLSLTAAGEQARLRRRRLRENPMADPEFAAAVRGDGADGVDRSDVGGGGGDNQGIDLDPGKFRRRAEARARRSHEETLYRSFSRMQQYTPNASRRDPNNPNAAFARRRARARAANRSGRSPVSDSLTASSERVPRGWRAPYVQSSRQRRRSARRTRVQGRRGRSGSGLGRRGSFASEIGEDEDGAYYQDNAKGPTSSHGHADEDVADDDRATWERLRDDLTDVIVSDGLYKLSDLRALFHETVVAAAGDDVRAEEAAGGRHQPEVRGQEDDEADPPTRKAAAQRAVAFVCSELDLPAIARLALQTPELLAPNFEGLRSTRGGGSGGSYGSGSGPSDSEGSNDRPLKITHWSESQDYAFRTQDYGRMDDDVLGM